MMRPRAKTAFGIGALPWRLRSSLLLALGVAVPVLPGVTGGCSSDEASKPELGVSALLFVKRAHTTSDGSGAVTVDVAGGNGQVVDYDRYVPGGSLDMLKPARADGQLINLTAGYPEADFNGADVSFDGKQAVFSMKKDRNDKYHLYTVQLDGSAEMHQKTAGDQNDITPRYLPGGRIVFVTDEMYTEMGTRADEYEHSRSVTQLATISVDGGDADRHLFSQNLSHTVAPFVRYDGKIGYSRWEHVAAVNDVKIMTANPDSTEMLAVAGQHGKPANSLVNVTEIAPNVMIGIATTRNRTIHAGAIIKIDARNQNDPACLDPNPDNKTGHACLDEENVKYEILTPNVPTGNGPSPVGRYREPAMLPDGRLLVSWAEGPVNDLSEVSRTPPDFGIYVFDPATQTNQLIYNDRDTWDLNALPVAPRKEPPIIGDLKRVQDPNEPVRIGSVDVTNTSLRTETVDGAQFKATTLPDALHGATAVRIIEGFSSEAATKVTMFGLTMHEGAAVLGEAPIYGDGSWLANVPPYIPMRLQPIDKFGMAIRSQTTWIQGIPGEDRRCVGCHEARTGQGVPRYGQNPTVAEQRQAMAFVQPISDRLEVPWDKNDLGKNFVQKLLNEKCVQCHNTPEPSYTVTITDPTTGQAKPYKIPYFSLTADPIAAYYDRQAHEYNTSYVSIFYPAAMEMEMGRATVVGQTPPTWGVPGSARASKLIEKINVKAADGSTAWPTPLHPEDKGVTLTDEERRLLILAMDLGGQYFSRQNTGFVPLSAPTGVKY